MSTYISISEMAKLHGITRQTLIHYDNIDLFKPAKVDTNGYRYYCKHQIPYLREICFLKSLGISLKDIQQHFQERTPEKRNVSFGETKTVYYESNCQAQYFARIPQSKDRSV